MLPVTLLHSHVIFSLVCQSLLSELQLCLVQCINFTKKKSSMRASASSICCCSRRQLFTSNVIHNFQERPFSRLHTDMICLTSDPSRVGSWQEITNHCIFFVLTTWLCPCTKHRLSKTLLTLLERLPPNQLQPLCIFYKPEEFICIF